MGISPAKKKAWETCVKIGKYSYGHLPVITGYFNGIIHSINGVLLVLITDKWP